GGGGGGGSSRARPLERGGRGVAPHTSDHPSAASSRLDRQRDDALLLGRREGRGFTRGPAGDEQADATCDLPVDQRPKPRLVDFTGGVERGDQGRAATAQDRKSTRLNSSHVAISYAVFCL